FYWVIAALAGLFAASAAVNVAGRAELRQRIAFTPDGLLVPKSKWSSEEALIPYGAVLDVQEFTEPNAAAVVRHSGGEFTVELDLLPSERAYAEILQALAARVQAARATPAAPAKPE